MDPLASCLHDGMVLVRALVFSMGSAKLNRLRQGKSDVVPASKAAWLADRAAQCTEHGRRGMLQRRFSHVEAASGR